MEGIRRGAINILYKDIRIGTKTSLGRANGELGFPIIGPRIYFYSKQDRN